LRELTVKQAKSLIARRTEGESDVDAYLPWAVRACEQGVKRTHLISGHVDDSLLLELFTHKGVGTLLTPDPIQALRVARPDDIGGIQHLIEPLEAEGILVKRNRGLLESEINRFVVLEHDGIVIACAALYPFPEERAGELAGLAVHPDFRNQGAGERLVKEIEARARRMKLKRLDIDVLPGPKRALYNYQRRSVVLVKRL
jgi:amino-acid N-acetyltransferase